MRKILLLFALLLLPRLAKAVEIDGIYYNLIDKAAIAEVVRSPNDSYTGTVVIPESVVYLGKTYSVTSIGGSAFHTCNNLTSVTIPNSVTEIGAYAFYDCKNLKSLVIPQSLVSVGKKAFDGCYNLLSLYISDIAAWCKIKFESFPFWYQPHSLYLNGEEIVDLIIPDNVSSIGDYAFCYCDKIESVTIPTTVTSIGRQAFTCCSNLTSVHITDLTAWCNISFNTPQLSDYHLYINGEEVKELIIPNNVYSLGDCVFSGCAGITSVTIPNHISSIGYDVFSGCTGLTSVVLPNSISTIPSGAFYGCRSLSSITIPNSVTTIENATFTLCSGLKSVYIGKNVRKIDSYAFSSCQELSDVYCLADNVPNTNKNAFDNSYIEYGTLHVPYNLINNYKTTIPWSSFGNFKTLGEKCATPTINYNKGKLTFNSDTENVIFRYNITDSDIKAGSSQEVQLGVTYNISVYATKDGYENSETATATLCWIEVEPKTEGINSIAQVRASAVMIKTEQGQISIEGADDNTDIRVYNIDGVQVGSATSRNGIALVNTNLTRNATAIIKIGTRSVKVIMK